MLKHNPPPLSPHLFSPYFGQNDCKDAWREGNDGLGLKNSKFCPSHILVYSVDVMTKPAKEMLNLKTAPKTVKAVTPMIEQFLGIKESHTDYLLFYRMGDFYELFFDDALAAAAALDITLTHRGTHLGQAIPMCGVPYHASDIYLQRLIRKGFKVAICEQTENPADAKKRGNKSVVRREVVRLVTPGTLTEDALLEARAHNYLAALAYTGESGADAQTEGMALAWLDMSTGDVQVMSGNGERLQAQLAGLMPRELLIPENCPEKLRQAFEATALRAAPDVAMSIMARSQSGVEQGRKALEAAYQLETLDGFGVWTRAQLAAAGTLMTYLELTQIGKMPRLKPPQIINDVQGMRLDAATRNNLELMQTLAGERKGSLLATIDHTVSGAGARLLASRLATPLTDAALITARHDAVSFFTAEDGLRDDLRQAMRGVPDMARGLARLTLGRGGPRDMKLLVQGLEKGFSVSDLLSRHADNDTSAEIKTALEPIGRHNGVLEDLVTRFKEALAEDVPMLARDGGFIAESYDAGLDEIRRLRDESRRIIAGLQNKYAEETGVKVLKIKYNAVLGYHIDVPAAHGDKLMVSPHRETFIHRQTLANSVRFSTSALADLAGEISRAGEKALALELALYDSFLAQIASAAAQIAAAADGLAVLDVACANAELAVVRNWVRPQIFEDTRLHVEAGRHPVVEAALSARQGGAFVANDCRLNSQNVDDADACHLMLLTGPNMAGKSTYLRQNALLVILAQIGCFVPAKRAEIGLVDQVFSRVGAADDLAQGRSTFMVEMVETAAILNQATSRSLVILDEIGRGTATFDGLSLAWAAVEHLHEVNGCRALFATHYHELTALAGRLSGLANATMKVKEYKGDVVFLHEVGAGAADRSYGIHVAQLAGLPKTVIARARAVLAILEESQRSGNGGSDNATLENLPLFDSTLTPPLNAPSSTDAAISTALKDINPDALSPREALEALYRLRKIYDDEN